jgi:hypothetical protein
MCSRLSFSNSPRKASASPRRSVSPSVCGPGVCRASAGSGGWGSCPAAPTSRPESENFSDSGGGCDLN